MRACERVRERETEMDGGLADGELEKKSASAALSGSAGRQVLYDGLGLIKSLV